MRRKHRRLRGSMVLELVIASGLSVIVIALLVMAEVSALREYQRALARNAANRGAYNALREVRSLVQQAVQGSVNASGTQATLLLPQRDASGAIRLPVQPDHANPVQLTVNFATGTLTVTAGGVSRVLLTGVLNRTPQGAPYNPFTLTEYAPGVQALHVRLCVQQGNIRTASTAWFEETILLRNPVSP
ncbi:MAG: hypothetical protein ABDI19_08220 [Armatimonadota bacterium]